MSKIKKIIILVFVFIFAFTSIFSVSAFTFIDAPNVNTSFGDFILKNLQVSILGLGGGDLIESVASTPVEAYDGGIRLKCNLVTELLSDFTYTVVLNMRVPDYILDTNDLFLGSYDICLRRNDKFFIDEVTSSFRRSNSVGQQNSKYRITSFDNFPCVRVIYDKQTIGNQYEYYQTSFTFTTTDDTDYVYLYLLNYKMKLENPNADTIDNANSNTSSIIKDNASNTSKVQSSIAKTESNISSNISSTQSAITSNADKNASDIQSNADKNAQDIKDHQTQLQEDEKSEANTTGNDGADSVGSAIPNDSEGFINSLGNLVSAVSYNGTDCNWELPSVSIPKIKGVIPVSIKLWDKLEIPFEYWISKIPSNVLKLVQSVLTVALIVYCFKELYSIISYVLTLRGGGADE